VIPVLLLKGKGLYKTVKFKNPKYIGDPINSVRIFNEKEVDELVFLDIGASSKSMNPDYCLLGDIASEAFMPMAYGGGLKTIEQIRKIFSIGFEKVILNTVNYSDYELIKSSVSEFGSQSIVGCLDVKRSVFNRYDLFSTNGSIKQNLTIMEHLTRMVDSGVGEILINSIDKDGTMSGYDLKLIKKVTDAVKVPVIACGGASCVNDFKLAVSDANASAVAAGSMFVFMGPHRAVLINYPERKELIKELP
tara:strand:+ start:4067 stop:4813 length:747 start_codon:yes stop_codon:yes gene_type:complete